MGYAIPIDRALQIAQQIDDGDESNGVYVGSQRALLGVGLEASGSDGYGSFGFEGGASSPGAVVSEVQSDGAAADAGLAAGDTIVGVDGTDVAFVEQAHYESQGASSFCAANRSAPTTRSSPCTSPR